MHGVGPTYCETLISTFNSIPIEPINTLTSFAPFIFGVLAVVWLYRTKRGTPLLYAIAFGTAATGLGSVLWHGLRTPLALSLDVFPGLITFGLIAWTWPYLLGGRWWAYSTILSVFGGTFLLEWIFRLGESNGPPRSIFFVVFLVGAALTYLTYKRVGARCSLGAVVVLTSAVIAATARTIDLSTCTVIPIGTHFLWHIFLGAAGAGAVFFLSCIQKKQATQ